MKLIAISIIFLLLFVSCASPRPWTKQEKITAGYFLLAHSADAFTTNQGIDNDNYELNPILGKYPSDTEINLYFSLTALISLSLSHFYPKLRKQFLYGYGTLNSVVTIHNYNVNNRD